MTQAASPSISATRSSRARRFSILAVAGALALTAAPFTTLGAEHASDPRYSLIDSPLMRAARAQQQQPLLQLDGVGALAGHELRMSAQPSVVGLTLLGAEPLPSLHTPRATWRYTLVERPSWAWKVGVSGYLRESTEFSRLLPERGRFGALPLMHVGGEAQLSRHWQLSLDADGLMTPRGRALDIDMRVHYRLSPTFSLYGGWRVSEAGGDAEEVYGAGVNNAANVGVRLRF